MDLVSVNIGDIVMPGSILGTLGRTGRNAYPKNSFTYNVCKIEQWGFASI